MSFQHAHVEMTACLKTKHWETRVSTDIRAQNLWAACFLYVQHILFDLFTYPDWDVNADLPKQKYCWLICNVSLSTPSQTACASSLCEAVITDLLFALLRCLPIRSVFGFGVLNISSNLNSACQFSSPVGLLFSCKQGVRRAGWKSTRLVAWFSVLFFLFLPLQHS